MFGDTAGVLLDRLVCPALDLVVGQRPFAGFADRFVAAVLDDLLAGFVQVLVTGGDEPTDDGAGLVDHGQQDADRASAFPHVAGEFRDVAEGGAVPGARAGVPRFVEEDAAGVGDEHASVGLDLGDVAHRQCVVHSRQELLIGSCLGELFTLCVPPQPDLVLRVLPGRR